MARKRSSTLTEAEARLMDIVWHKGRATVCDVMEALPDVPPLAYSTVLTTMRILEQKGFVRHVKEGRAFLYEPIVDRGEAGGSAIAQILTRFFRDSPELLVMNLLAHESVGKKELKRLKKLIEEAK